MFKKNIRKILLSSGVILLPILFGILVWRELPDAMMTHWGADTHAGVGGKVFAVFGLPVLLLAGHLLGLFFTSRDQRQNEQNPKALGMIFWILPVISLFANGISYAAAFGKTFDFALLMPALLGVLFLFIGNYLPKVKPNRTLGIKIYWTLHNEENWQKTHRFGGKVWVIGGLILLFSVFLPLSGMLLVAGCTILAMIVLPVLYSYRLYRQHQKEGVVYAALPKSKAEKTTVTIAAVLLPILFAGIAVLMVTGNIEVHCEDTAFQIHATYWADVETEYSAVDAVEYREDFQVGARIQGFSSARLSLGVFQNEEFGTYTLYAYTGAKGFVVLTSGGEKLVVGMRDSRDAQALYDSLSAKIKP